MWSCLHFCTIVVWIVRWTTVSANILYEDDYFTTSELIKVRGFEAIDHHVTTNDGYILNLVEVRNPEIPGGYNRSKEPILFIHGIINNVNFFIVNANGARAVNHADLDASSIGENELLKMFKSNPAAKSLPLLASIFGHHVWLLNRRGTSQSQNNANLDKAPLTNPIEDVAETLVGGFIPPLGRKKRQADNKTKEELSSDEPNGSKLKELQGTFNPRYWNFSLDEQARYDVPRIIEYVLKETNKEKLALVGHSAGSALILMSLSKFPDLADNVTKAILWGPALYINSVRDVLSANLARLPLVSYIGPILPKSLQLTLEYFLETICSSIILRSVICEPIIDIVYGAGASQLDLTHRFFRITTDFESSHSLGSLSQAAIKGKMHYYDYMNPQRNLIAYNQTSPPLYDVSRIKLRTISLWSGVTDGLVPYRTALAIGNDMSVPVEQVYLNESGLLFNHISYAIHHDLPRLVTIPALKRIES